MIAQVGSRLARAEPVGARLTRAGSTAAVARRATRPPSATPASVTMTVQPSPSPTSAPSTSALQDVVAPALSYGAWTHANPHLTRQERVEGLRKFMAARGAQSERQASSPIDHDSANNTAQPVGEVVTTGISCAQQPRTRAERIAQIQRFADATRAVDQIDYSHMAETVHTTDASDPIIVSPLPAGWRLSASTGMPVFSYGEWLHSHDGSQMDRTSAARQFMRYVRQ